MPEYKLKLGLECSLEHAREDDRVDVGFHHGLRLARTRLMM